MNPVFRSAVLVTAIATSLTAFAQTPAAKPQAAKPAAAKPAAAKPASTLSERQKVSVMIGMEVAKSLQPIRDEVDPAIVIQAMQATLAGRPTGLTDAQAAQVQAEFGQRMQGKMAAKAAAEGQKNLDEGNRFLAANKSKPGVHTTASGLQYQVLRAGAGPSPKATDTVRVNYVGTLLNGTKFDSSYDHGQPAEFALNQVIPGWQEGVALMAVGSKYRLWVPAKLGYGQSGPPPIGPNSTLVFDVELLSVTK